MADAAAHGAGADHGHGLDIALGGVRRHIRDLARSALGQEQVAQRARLGRPHQVDEQLALEQQAIGKFALGGSLDGVHALGGRREVLAHALDHVARELEVRVALGVLARQVAYQRQRAHIGHALRKGQGLGGQGFGRGHQLVEQLLARQHADHFALDGFAADDHVQSRFHAQHAGQALRAASARQDAQLDFGQGHAATGGATR
jgi:hypothetical protein